MAGVGTVFVVYRLTRTLWDEATALVAALFLALTFIHVRDSHFGTTDIAMTFLIVMSVSFLVRAHLTGQRHLFALAGLAGGLATATKYNGVFLAAPFVVSQVLHAVDSPGRRVAALLDARAIWFGVPFVLALALGIPFVVADADRFWAAMGELTHSMQFGQGELNARERVAAPPHLVAPIRRRPAAAADGDRGSDCALGAPADAPLPCCSPFRSRTSLSRAASATCSSAT